jgi:hypothetical protein
MRGVSVAHVVGEIRPTNCGSARTQQERIARAHGTESANLDLEPNGFCAAVRAERALISSLHKQLSSRTKREGLSSGSDQVS